MTSRQSDPRSGGVGSGREGGRVKNGCGVGVSGGLVGRSKCMCDHDTFGKVNIIIIITTSGCSSILTSATNICEIVWQSIFTL